jgi:cytosine/adenosine deaminase-related metal-dependent hydrolase
MATLNGTKALGLGAITGSLTPGKRADVIMINTCDVNIAPMGHLNTTVVSLRHRRMSTLLWSTGESSNVEGSSSGIVAQS